MTEGNKKNIDESILSDDEKVAKKQPIAYRCGASVDEDTEDNRRFSWSAVAYHHEDASVALSGLDNFMANRIEFSGKNLAKGKFANENFENANFSVANLREVDFSGANLKGVDFSGADLTGANLSGADLTGAILSNAVLKDTDLTGAILNGVVLTDVNLDNAILLDIQIDAIALEDLQELIEYLAKHAPHKLNLAKMNLKVLNLARLDLKNLNLRGVDFTGCDFTGVNIMELDLSECIITPQQIAQALGHVPNAAELRMIMAPKNKGKEQDSFLKNFDISDLFRDDGREAGVWDVVHDKGISVQKVVDVVQAGHKVYRKVVSRPEKEERAEASPAKDMKKDVHSSADDLKKVLDENKRALIEKHKQEELEARRNKKLEAEQVMTQEKPLEKQQEKEMEKQVEKEPQKPRINQNVAERLSAFRDRSRE